LASLIADSVVGEHNIALVEIDPYACRQPGLRVTYSEAVKATTRPATDPTHKLAVGVLCRRASSHRHDEACYVDILKKHVGRGRLAVLGSGTEERWIIDVRVVRDGLGASIGVNGDTCIDRCRAK